MRVLRAADHVRMAWRNGGGETVEIAAHPPGAGLAAFDWRVSAATVAADGPFSSFPGIDRTLALLDGAGMALTIEGHGRHHLTAASAPLAFPGDAVTACHLIDGAITDLNVMTRRGAVRHRVRRLSAGDLPVEARGRWIVLVAGRRSRIVVGGRAVLLERLDAVVLGAEATLEPDGDAALYAIEFDPAPAHPDGDAKSNARPNRTGAVG